MRPVCKFYINSECTNPRCKFLHPVEYPVYIYTLPGIDIHPDELRLAVMSNEAMTAEADNIWINNYKIFCSESGEKEVDILQYPDYFCMPFDTERVWGEIENFRSRFKQRGSEYSRPYQSQYQPKSGFSQGYNKGYTKGYTSNYQMMPRQPNNPPPRSSNWGGGFNNSNYQGGPPMHSFNRPYDNNNRSYDNRHASSWNQNTNINNNGDSFERKSNFEQKPTNTEGNMPDYEYQNIPYNYK
ncbi:uncharacterized protein VICG_00278 [Vittaforma corneae ATCC 50505]|uniref:C3H1-type domain-containing protein n=1 Tax=Vittaforma corneae (strain ATCC 50505) TaxID=993615 RepID=L2GNW1_VITCO|nr:uncharacterized protein VICG_00278 [Vittaforma corneae ATCC 50505]ELA42526.1 hypothetical protein VICG_00278 [Vittaforma corneae ATCC 50505]